MGGEIGVDDVVIVVVPHQYSDGAVVAGRERGLGETEAMDMIAAQMPAELKRARADIIIDNDGSLDDLAARTSEAWESLDQLAGEGVSVPGGFATTAAAFSEFIARKRMRPSMRTGRTFMRRNAVSARAPWNVPVTMNSPTGA